MALFDGVIIVSDIDGTFLGKGSRIVSENIEKIAYFKDNGGLFTVATGREHYLVYPSVPQIEQIVNYPAVVCNGAYMYDFQTHRASEETFLDDEPLLPLLDEIATACPKVAWRVGAQGKLFVEYIHPLVAWVGETFPDRMLVTPLDTLPKGCWHKVAFDGPPDEVDRAEAILGALDNRYVRIRSGAEVVEIQSAKATKGTLVKRLKNLLPHVTTWTIGDYENDYAMMLSSDRCAVPENGIDKLKAIPNVVRVCDCDQGAIADLIDHIEKELKS